MANMIRNPRLLEKSPRAARLSKRLDHTPYVAIGVGGGQVMLCEVANPHRQKTREICFMGPILPTEPHHIVYYLRRERDWQKILNRVTDALEKQKIMRQMKEDQILDELGEEAEKFFRENGWSA